MAISMQQDRDDLHAIVEEALASSSKLHDSEGVSVTLREESGDHHSPMMIPVCQANSDAMGASMGSPLVAATQSVRSGASNRSFSQRTVTDMTVDGLRHSCLTLTSTALGGGLLAVSYVFFQVGLGLGAMMLVSGACLAYLSTVALMNISTEIGHDTYAGLFSYCAGPRAGPILDAMLFVYGNGTCVGYLVFLGDFIPALAKLAAPAGPDWSHSRWLAISGSALVILPLVLQRELGALRHFTPVSILSLIYVAVVIAGRSAYFYHLHETAPDHADYGEVTVFGFNANFFNAFAICVFAFNCHINVVPIAGRLVRPTKARIRKVASWVNLLQVCFYLLIGSTGYLTFLAKCPQDILKGFKDDDPFMAVGRVLLSFTMMVAIPLNMQPSVRCGLQIRDYFYPDSPILAPSPMCSPRSSPQSSPRIDRKLSPNSLDSSGRPSATNGSMSQATEAAMPRILLTLGCLITQVCVAIACPGVADVLSILGATVATAMMFVIPAYCMGKVLPYSAAGRCQQVVLLLFALVSVSSVPVKVLQSAGVLSK